MSAWGRAAGRPCKMLIFLSSRPFIPVIGRQSVLVLHFRANSASVWRRCLSAVTLMPIAVFFKGFLRKPTGIRLRPAGFSLILPAALALLWSLAFQCCLESSPEPSENVGSAIVTPDDPGVLVSEDGRVVVNFPAGVVDRPTTFRITTIPREHYPDLYWLQSDVYQIEPSRELNKKVQVVIDLSGMEGKGFQLSKLYNMGALAIREVLPAERPVYLKTLEKNQVATDDSVHRVLVHNTKRLGAFGVFVHECYLLCEKTVTCDAYEGGGGLEYRDRLLSCMDGFECLGNVEKMNGDEMAEVFLCSQFRPCRDSFGCCLPPVTCESGADGDLIPPATTDGDEDIDLDAPPPDGDGDRAGTGDPDGEIERDRSAPDGDEDRDLGGDRDAEPDLSEEFSPIPCGSDGACPEGLTCVRDPSHPAFADITGYCLAMSDYQIAMYVRDEEEEKWTKMEGPEGGDIDLMVDCAGKGPEEGGGVESPYDLRVKVSDEWWKLTDEEGITIKIFKERELNNSGTPSHEGITDENGECVFDNIYFTNEWFVIVSERNAADDDRQIVPTHEWGLFVTRDEADKHLEIPVDIHPLNVGRYKSFAARFSQSMPEGTGMIIGQVVDCRAKPPYVLANVSVGFMEARPKIMGSFQNQFLNPSPRLPREGEIGTNVNGLFIGLYLPPQQKLTAFAFGMWPDGAGELKPQLVGLTISGHLQLAPDSVTIVRFNTYH